MFLLFLRFEIPKSKLLEFNMANTWMTTWSVYTNYAETSNQGAKTFEIIKTWYSEEEKQADLESQIFENLMGTVSVLGQIHESHIYYILKDEKIAIG